ncbi:hypothetical protein BDZ89DRAFT_1064291 [Hymenopellis radicata]|nr:hypothetical protein BDZ89DRAFT_1064291 [Hymenopellis radicata]
MHLTRLGGNLLQQRYHVFLRWLSVIYVVLRVRSLTLSVAPTTLANLKRLSIQSPCILLQLTTPNLTSLSLFPRRVFPDDLQTVQDFVACLTSNCDITSACIKRFCMSFYPEAGKSSATFKLIASDVFRLDVRSCARHLVPGMNLPGPKAVVETLMEMVAYRFEQSRSSVFCEYVCVRIRTCFAKKGFLVSRRMDW